MTRKAIMKTEVSAGGVIVRKVEDTWEVLLMKDMNGNWTFPKGIIEKDEDPRAAARREVSEEVGLKNLTFIAPLRSVEYMYYRQVPIRKTVHYFLFQSKGDDKLKPQKAEGISDVQWFTLLQALKIIGYTKTNRPMLENAMKSMV